MQVLIAKKRNDAIIPTLGSDAAAGYDLYAALDAPVTIAQGASARIDTGLAFALPKGTFGAIFARSGLSTKQGLRPANCVGVIDADYRGNVIVVMHNDSTEPRVIEKGQRIAQMVLLPFIPMDFEEVSKLDVTERGSGGFGSTGKA